MSPNMELFVKTKVMMIGIIMIYNVLICKTNFNVPPGHAFQNGNGKGKRTAEKTEMKSLYLQSDRGMSLWLKERSKKK